MSWLNGPLLGFDTESTGVDTLNDRIVTTALVDITPGQRPTVATELINPGVDIPEEAAAIHGITTEHAQTHGRPPEEVLFEVTGRIALAMTNGIPVVAANAAYDFTLLEVENRRYGLPTLADRLPGGRYGVVVDPMVLDKHYDPYRKAVCVNNKPPCGCGAVDKKLTSLCLHYGVRFSATGAHDAGADALAACRLVPKIAGRFPELVGMVPAHLHQLQVRWRGEQMKSLRSYFDRTGVEHDGCDGGWPLRTDVAAGRVRVA